MLPARTSTGWRGGGVALEQVTAWRPAVAGVAEVLHAAFVEHVYPAHTHDTWTLLIVEDGAIRYEANDWQVKLVKVAGRPARRHRPPPTTRRAPSRRGRDRGRLRRPAHLTRHFARQIGTTPARYTRSAPRRPGPPS